MTINEQKILLQTNIYLNVRRSMLNVRINYSYSRIHLAIPVDMKTIILDKISLSIFHETTLLI